MPERSIEGQAGAWHHHTLRTPGLAKCVKMYLVRYPGIREAEHGKGPVSGKNLVNACRAPA